MNKSKKSNIPNVKTGLDEIKNEVLNSKDNMISIREDMLKMMDKIDKLESAVRILANRLNRVDGLGK